MYEVLRDFENYEISPEYPHEIINVITGKIAKETLDIKSGYIKVRLNHKSYYKHRIIAFQFIPNDDPKKRFVDHINHIRTDNHIENLRWVTPSENNRNRSGYKKPYEFVDELPEESISVNHYIIMIMFLKIFIILIMNSIYLTELNSENFIKNQKRLLENLLLLRKTKKEKLCLYHIQFSKCIIILNKNK